MQHTGIDGAKTKGMVEDESGWPNLDNEFRFTGWTTARDSTCASLMLHIPACRS